MTMIAHIYLKEMKRNRTSILIWGVLLAALILMGMSFFPIIMQGEALKQLQGFFETPFMKGWMEALGATPNIMANVLGFYATRNALFIVLMGNFFAILLGGRLLAQEEYEKTAEFLLTRPVTRTEVMAGKLAVLATGVTVITAVIFASGYLSLELFKGDSDYRFAAFLVHTVYSFLLMQLFGAFGLFLSLLMRRARPMTTVGIGIVAGTFFLDMVSRFAKSADWIGYIGPFKFMDGEVLRPDYGLTWWRVLYFVGLTLGLWALSFVVYRKKDILV
jgi:ABC-2 type transport system permease protein